MCKGPVEGRNITQEGLDEGQSGWSTKTTGGSEAKGLVRPGHGHPGPSGPPELFGCLSQGQWKLLKVLQYDMTWLYVGCETILLDGGRVERETREGLEKDYAGLGWYDGGSGLAGGFGNRSTGFAYKLGVGFRKREELGMIPQVFTYPTGAWW